MRLNQSNATPVSPPSGRLRCGTGTAPSKGSRAPSRAGRPLTPGACVFAGLPGVRGEPRSGASERVGARPSGLLCVAARARPLSGAAHPLRPPLPALARALPGHRPDALVAAAGSQLARPLAQRLAHTADCGCAHNPRARRGRLGRDQRLTPLPGHPPPAPASGAGPPGGGGSGSPGAAGEGREGSGLGRR